MKLIIIKKEKRISHQGSSKKGFALLFAVLVASLLLTIGLSIFSTTLKELAIATASRQSVYAFYAADSGRECVKYWDTQRGQIPGLFSAAITGQISCGKSPNINVTGEYYKSGVRQNPIDPFTADYVFVRVPAVAALGVPGEIYTTNKDASSDTNINGQNYYVEVTKGVSNRGAAGQTASTTIISYGHDSTGGDRIERAIRQEY